MGIQQFVAAYRVDHDRLRTIIPDGYKSLRRVLRINAEVNSNGEITIELNTPVERPGFKGWLNVASWSSCNTSIHLLIGDDGAYEFTTPFLTLGFLPSGVFSECPAEKDSHGCIYLRDGKETLLTYRPVAERKEFCDFSFHWRFSDGDSFGKSDGKMIAAPFEPVRHIYPSLACTPELAAKIPCLQVLGAYTLYVR